MRVRRADAYRDIDPAIAWLFAAYRSEAVNAQEPEVLALTGQVARVHRRARESHGTGARILGSRHAQRSRPSKGSATPVPRGRRNRTVHARRRRLSVAGVTSVMPAAGVIAVLVARATS